MQVKRWFFGVASAISWDGKIRQAGHEIKQPSWVWDMVSRNLKVQHTKLKVTVSKLWSQTNSATNRGWLKNTMLKPSTSSQTRNEQSSWVWDRRRRKLKVETSNSKSLFSKSWSQTNSTIHRSWLEHNVLKLSYHRSPNLKAENSKSKPQSRNLKVENSKSKTQSRK